MPDTETRDSGSILHTLSNMTLRRVPVVDGVETPGAAVEVPALELFAAAAQCHWGDSDLDAGHYVTEQGAFRVAGAEADVAGFIKAVKRVWTQYPLVTLSVLPAAPADAGLVHTIGTSMQALEDVRRRWQDGLKNIAGSGLRIAPRVSPYPLPQAVDAKTDLDGVRTALLEYPSRQATYDAVQLAAQRAAETRRIASAALQRLNAGAPDDTVMEQLLELCAIERWERRYPEAEGAGGNASMALAAVVDLQRDGAAREIGRRAEAAGVSVVTVTYRWVSGNVLRSMLAGTSAVPCPDWCGAADGASAALLDNAEDGQALSFIDTDEVRRSARLRRRDPDAAAAEAEAAFVAFVDIGHFARTQAPLEQTAVEGADSTADGPQV